MKRLRIIGVDHYGLCTGIGVDGVAGNGFCFRNNQCPYYALDGNFTVFVGDIKTVAADSPAFVRDIFSRSRRHFERNASQGLVGERIPLVNHQHTGFRVFDNNRLRIAVSADDNICGGRVHHIAVRCLDLIQHISAGSEICHLDLTMRVRGKNTVLRQC